jgi:hypothetical protein
MERKGLRGGDEVQRIIIWNFFSFSFNFFFFASVYIDSLCDTIPQA